MKAFALLLLALLASHAVAVHAGICCDQQNCGTGAHCTDYGCDVYGTCSCRCVLNAGTIAGMVVGLVLLTVICALACRHRYRRRRAVFLAMQGSQAQGVDGQPALVYSAAYVPPQPTYVVVPGQAAYAYPPQQQQQNYQQQPQQSYQQQPAYAPQAYQPQH